ncbi:hypothetical protein EDC01DRAFT_696219 [Geopyxis carbonaria]|nr:hypothetical protein EDC01DRAFT_696219 [Geopyxis carbonaria]
MSSHFTTSFSSAAAGKDSGTSNHSGSSSTAGSGGGSGSADWTRRANGNSTSSATRRPSLSTTLTHSNAPLTSSSSNVYHPPHHYNRQTTAQNTTYGKDDLLNIFRAQESGSGFSKRLPELLDGDFNASSSTTGGWGRGGEESLNGVDLCWEKEGGVKPIGLEEIAEEEREFFSTNINSTQTHKPSNNNQGVVNHHNSTPPQNRGKTVGGTGTTPGSNRPTTRRRETSDAAAGGNPFGGTPPQISRRRTDLRESDDAGSPRDRTFFGRWGSTSGPPGDEENKEKEEGSGGTIGRNTGLFRRGSAAWGGSGNSGSGFTSNSALNSPMGTFGNSSFGGGAMGGFTLQSGEKSKAANSTASKARPGVEDVDERAEDEDLHKVVSNAVDDYDEDPRERPTTSDTDPFGLGGGRDENSQQEQRNSTPGIMDQQQRNMKTASPFSSIGISTSNAPRNQGMISTPTRTRQDLGFSSFGGSREGLGGAVPGMTGLQHQLQNLQFNDRGQVPLRRSREGSIGGALAGDNEPLSPAETNPFMSPPPEKADEENMPSEHNESGGLGSVIAGLRRGETGNIGHPGSDRSGRSSTAGLGSVGGPLGGGFGGLGSSGLWSSAGQIGTPIGTSTAQSSFFGGGGTQLGDISSPGGPGSGSLLSGGLGGLGGNTGFGSASRASRLGQLFPENMQHQDENQGFESDAFGNDPRFNAFGSRRGLGGTIDSPMRERGDVADLFGFPSARSLSNLAGTAAAQDNSLYHRDSADPLGLGQTHQNQGSPPQLAPTNQSGQPLRPPPGTVPSSQQHVMIMPDKINWVYRDPSGTIQGPFSGLEMHEWYRAGFFTQELAVKRVEDNDFEQLGILVRKIGNTREPFLVPLPGNIAGMSTNNASANWSETWLNEMPGAQQVQAAAQAQTPGGMQPPFAGSFPTFGTTLTAEQQNALERRKQEEQYLMAKQREFLLQQQIMAKQAAAVLHHQSSTQSLHSQPSFGSLHSPSGFAPATTPAAAAGVVGSQNAFEPGVLLRQAGAAAGGVDSLNMGGQMGGMQTPGGQFPQQQDQVLQMQQQQRMAEQQRQQLYRSEQTQHVQKQLQHAQEQAQQAHMKQQYETEQYDNQSEASLREQQHAQEILDPERIEEPEPEPKAPTPIPQEQPKVKIPKAPAAIKTSPAPKPSQTAWGQVTPLVQPFPPPPTQDSPQLGASPSVETPSASVAPWAKEEAQSVRGPSLKEIQELEAKQAAAREAAEAQARREQLSHQATHQPPPPAPGLPSTATWATSPSTTPAAGASAWSKPLAKAAPKSGAQQTLAQIQKEEENRKAKLAAAQASQAATVGASNPVVVTAGRGYAGVASKSANPVQVMGTGAWTTVGPGGRSRGAGGPPIGPAIGPAASGSALKTPSATFPATTQKKATSAVTPAKSATTSAQEEFMKWCRGSMRGLNPGYSPDTIMDIVNTFPTELDLVSDAIYNASSTMDGRRWAEEFMKRREAAGNGVVMDAGTSSGNGNGSGWNEVAKGRPAATPAATTGVPETNNAFRVVAGKKKGRRA